MKKLEKVQKETIVFPSADYRLFVIKGPVLNAERSFHEDIEIKVYLSGETTLMINSNVFLAKAGDITIVNPYEIHSNVSLSSGGEHYRLILGLDFLRGFAHGEIDLRREFIQNGIKLKNHIVGDKALCDILLKIVNEYQEKRENYRLLISSLITQLFIALFRDYVSVKDGAVVSQSRKAELLAPALNKIFNDYSQKITIDALAKLCSVSKYRFCHAFKEEMGVTAIQYLINYRISIASMLLENSRDSIESIAYRSGFEDLSYFYRCYKKIKGVSPKNSKKQIKN